MHNSVSEAKRSTSLTSNFLQEFFYLLSQLGLLTPFRLSWTYGYTQRSFNFKGREPVTVCLLLLIPFPLQLIMQTHACDSATLENNYTPFIQ